MPWIVENRDNPATISYREVDITDPILRFHHAGYYETEAGAYCDATEAVRVMRVGIDAAASLLTGASERLSGIYWSHHSPPNRMLTHDEALAFDAAEHPQPEKPKFLDGRMHP